MSRFHELFDGMLETVVVFNAFDSELPNVRVALNREDLEQYVLGLERQNAELAAALDRRKRCLKCGGTGTYLAYRPNMYETDSEKEWVDAIRMAERKCPDCAADPSEVLATHNARVAAEARRPLLEALREYRDALLNEEDTLDGPDGSPLPNWAMQASLLLNRILDKHEVEIEDYNEDGTEKSDGR